MNEVLLEKVRLGCSIPTDAQMWADMHVGIAQQMDFMADQVIFQFTSTVFKEKLPSQTISKVVEFSKPVTIEIYHHTSPWSFWKDNHITGRWVGWFVRLLKAPEFKKVTHTRVARHSETVTVDLKHSVIYPKAKAIASPAMGGVAIRWVEPEWK